MKKLIQQEIQKIPQDWISQFGTSDIPQSYLSEKQVRCSLKELESFLKNFASQIATAAKKEEAERIKGKIGWLRQWLNEDRITDIRKMVTNLQIEVWLFDFKKEEVHE